MAQLQPLVFGLAEELLSVSMELDGARLQQVLDSLTQQVRRERTHRDVCFSRDRDVTGPVSLPLRRDYLSTRSKTSW